MPFNTKPKLKYFSVNFEILWDCGLEMIPYKLLKIASLFYNKIKWIFKRLIQHNFEYIIFKSYLKTGFYENKKIK